MDFVIHRNLIGSKSHRMSNGSWVNQIPENCWIVEKTSNPKNNLLMALMLCGEKIEIEPPKLHSNIFRNFTFREDIPWEMVLSEDQFQEWVEQLSDKVSMTLERADLTYYEKVFSCSYNVLDSLRPMKIHKKKWQFLEDHEIEGISYDVVSSFEPNEEGFANKINYNLTDTVSGRLKVSSGPEILRLNKELKSIIRSRYKNGKIVQFDYVALEPRLALILAGHKVSNDIYSDINFMLFDGKLSREIVKVSTLSVMYGAGAQSLELKTGLPISDCKLIIKQLKEFFGIHKITKSLIEEYKNKKIIKNHFGRALYPESCEGHKLYSNFIQSSAVDAVMIGFSNIINLISTFDEKDMAIPIFVIHDNIGIDFHPSFFSDNNIQKIKDVGGEIFGLEDKLLLGSDTI